MLLNKLTKIPLPICGLALGCVALGNLLATHHTGFKFVLSLMSTIILMIVTVSFIVGFEQRKEQLQNSVIASVFATYFMAIGLLSANLSQYWPSFAKMLWLFALFGHLLYIIYFSFKFVRKGQNEQVIPSWFIVYVGLVACANVSRVFGYESIGRALVILGLIGFVIILVLNLMRIRAKHVLPEPIRPLNTVFTAPLNLCIVGYIALYNPTNNKILIALLLVSILILISTLVLIFRNNYEVFYPSFAAYTFPLVITVTAYKLANNHLGLSLAGVITILELLSTVVLVLVTFKYVCLIRSLLSSNS